MTRKFLSFTLASILDCGIAIGADSNYTTMNTSIYIK